MQNRNQFVRPEDKTRIRKNKKDLEKRTQKIIEILMDPSYPVDIRLLSKWERIITDQISIPETIPIMSQMLDIACGYKQLIIEGLWEPRDRLDLASYAVWFDGELKRIAIQGKKALKPEIQLELT